MITFIIKIFHIILEIIYMPIKLFPVKEKITFISRQSNVESVDVSMLKCSIKKKMPKCKVITLMRTIEPGIANKVMYCFYMLIQMYHIATSKVVILDSYCIVVSLLHHKKSLKVIQMWHALGLMKKAGYSILDKPEGRSLRLATAMKLHKNYQMIFASSENCREAMGRVFGYTKSSVYVYPLPRVDLLRNSEYIEKTKESIYKEYPQLKDRNIVLYAPTYRKQESKMEREVEKLLSIFPFHQYDMVCKLHPLSKIFISDSRVITKTSFTTMEWLTAADYVISDYSSIIYEAAVMKKSIIFYAFDLDSYQSIREFFIDYRREVPGPLCLNSEAVVDALKTYPFNSADTYSFAEKYVDLTISDCTERITDCINQLLK